MAISRAGAGSVAEAWANAVPTVFLPYPYHRDQHQRHNAEPLSGTGAAIVVRDMIDARANAKEMSGLLLNLITNDAQREQMVRLMRREAPPDGAEVVAAWLTEQVDAAAKVRR